MKKYFYLFMCMLTLSFTMVSLNSCDKEEDDEYYAGESEEDFKPNTYTVESSWDFTGVSSLTSQKQKELAEVMESACKASTLYNTKAEALEDFDKLVVQMSSDPDMEKYK